MFRKERRMIREDSGFMKKVRTLDKVTGKVVDTMAVVLLIFIFQYTDECYVSVRRFRQKTSL